MDLIPLEKQIIDLIHQHGMSDIVDELRSALKLSVRIQTIPRPDELSLSPFRKPLKSLQV